jgi:hypothetical protein
VGLGEEMLEKHDEEEYKEAKVGGNAIPLEGFQLGGVAVGGEHSVELARTRF